MQLALGAVGGYFFGPVGFMIGSVLGSLLSPSQKQEGPRLSNLKLQTSQYGQMIDIVYGTVRVAGNIVWQTDLVEHKHSSGGKGGAQVTTYTYTASFATKICKGPVIGLRRVWADGTLIYDATGSGTVDNTQVPITFYKGLETASPDPTMEAALGVGNVPAFRDDAAAVFTDWDLGAFGNRIPNLSFEVMTAAGPIPTRVYSWTVPSSGGTVGGNTIANAEVLNGKLYLGRYVNNASYTQDIYQFDGTHISQPVNHPSIPDIVFTGGPLWFIPVVNVAGLAFGQQQQGGTTNVTAWFLDGVQQAGPVINGAGGGDYFSVGTPPVLLNGNLYAVGSSVSNGVGTVARYPCPGGNTPSVTPDKTALLPDGVATAAHVLWSNDSFVWVMIAAPALSTLHQLYKFDQDLNLLDSWTKAQMPTEFQGLGNPQGVVYNGMLCLSTPTGHTTGAQSAIVYSIDAAHGFTFLGDAPCLNGTLAPLGNGGLVLSKDGVLNLNPDGSPATLSAIVADISTRCGLSSGQIDVTALTDLVAGYTIDKQSDGRSDILPLQSAYFFDCVESSGIAKFVKRGGPIAVSIPDTDLAAQQAGEQPPPLVEVKRMQEIDLPATLTVTYTNEASDYQDSTQIARRQIALTTVTGDIRLPIVMTDQKARQVAYVNLFSAWMERNGLVIRTSRKYAYLEPTDVITAHGYTMRIIRKRESVAGVIEFEAVESNAGLYTAAPTGNPAQGASTPTSVTTQATALLLLDLPLISDSDLENGYYAAMAGAVDNTWRGAALNKSADGGATYASVAQSAVAAVMGVASNALPGFGSGNIFDESNALTVVIGAGGGTLASAAEASVLNGANEAVIGSEIIQFKNATLTAPSTYALSGLLRGRRGTEWAIGSHVSGESFVLLPVLNVDAPSSELALPRAFKAVTFGRSLADASPVTFTNSGNALRPYSPVQLGGAPITPFDGTVQITWNRRTRIGGAWVDFVDVPLSEGVEDYIVQIWDSTFTKCARIIETTTRSATYTAAQQVADFGATQQTIYATVGQKGAFLLGLQSSVVVPGLGASSTAPIAPIAPYNSSPPPSAGGCVLPVQSDTYTAWPGQEVKYNPNAGPADTWVLSFTTGAAVLSGAGTIAAAEYGGPPTQRTMTLGLSPCGAPLNGGAVSNGSTVSIIFYMTGNPYPTQYPTLLPSTTYYVSINSIAPSGMLCVLTPP